MEPFHKKGGDVCDFGYGFELFDDSLLYDPFWIDDRFTEEAFMVNCGAEVYEVCDVDPLVEQYWSPEWADQPTRAPMRRFAPYEEPLVNLDGKPLLRLLEKNVNQSWSSVYRRICRKRKFRDLRPFIYRAFVTRGAEPNEHTPFFVDGDGVLRRRQRKPSAWWLH